ncbi:diguanylate cyclase domain-containing protein [uncultured Methylobacterium sp.]|uniref:diguanylate cyclase domain-containing protein n=1 Tax=uncultured Methylobacterium sp. TaxID=157278 RepID=UPI0035CA0FC7
MSPQTHPSDPESWLAIFDALNNIPHGFCVYDAQDRLLFVNEGFTRIYRQPVSSLPSGTHFLEVLTKSVALGNYSGRTPDEIWRDRKAFIDRREPGIFLQALGDGRLIAITHQPLANEGWAAVYEDVTERRRQETHLQFMAHHDALTRLPNRLFFDATLRAKLGDLSEGRTLALLCLDLDGFKAVNDRLGHASGDALLCQVAERLRSTLKESGMPARLGGDEFAVILPDTTQAIARGIAERLEESLSRHYVLGSASVADVGASIGLAVAPLHARYADALLAAADEDLYRVKRLRRDHARASLACSA